MGAMQETMSAVLKAANERGLPLLMIGGNAVITLGYARGTVDIDFMVPVGKRSQWLDLMRELGFRLLLGTEAFAQFSPGTEGRVGVDLMWVDEETWEKMKSGAVEDRASGEIVRVPKPENLIALKLHAIASPYRKDKEKDWGDIRHILIAWQLDPEDSTFREIILRHGGEDALRRMIDYRDES